VDEHDRELRNTTYAAFVDLGRAPTRVEIAALTATTPGDVQAAWWRLHDAHALVLHDDGSIRMANPFSAVATVHRVHADGRSWFANCAWDAIGICAALGSDGDIETECPCCGDRLELRIADRAPHDESLLFHCLVPAVAWWDDIGFT
jgi:hypothetical protein